jgi:hypothetical protein
MCLERNKAQEKVIARLEHIAISMLTTTICRHPAFCVELSRNILKEQMHPSKLTILTKLSGLQMLLLRSLASSMDSRSIQVQVSDTDWDLC